MFPIIKSEWDFALWAMLFGMAAFAYWCEKFRWGRNISAVVIVISLSIILTNLKIIPSTADVYDGAWDFLVPIVIPLLLFRANLKKVAKESGATLIAFLLGAIGVVLGTWVGISVLDLGNNESELAGIFTATYIGGGVNFAATVKATNFQQGDILAASVAADNVATNIYVVLLIMLPAVTWIHRCFKTEQIDNAFVLEGGHEESADDHNSGKINLFGLCLALTTAFTIAALGEGAAYLTDSETYSILYISFFTLLVSTLMPNLVKKFSGDEFAGQIAILLFLGALAASADIWVMLENAPILFVFAWIIIGVHLIFIFVAGWIFKLDLGEVIIGSIACIGGPTVAGPLARAKGWNSLALPGILVGTLGYAIGTFIGFGFFEFLSRG